MPIQFPWETPPVQGPPSPSQALLKRISGLGKLGVEPSKTTGTYYNKGTTPPRMASSNTTAAMRYKQGLSDATRNNTNWFRKVEPSKVTNIKNTRPLWQQGKVISRSTSTSLATRGAVGLAITKYGSGGGGGEFSK